MTFINSLPTELTGFEVKEEDEIYWRCSIEVSEPRKHEEENERDWKSRRETVVYLGVERQEGRKFVLLFRFFFRGTYFTRQ